jgi:hypothetical protein
MCGTEFRDFFRELGRCVRVQDHCFDQLDDIHRGRVAAAVRRHVRLDQSRFNLCRALGADLCVPKIRFCNIGGEGRRELGVI